MGFCCRDGVETCDAISNSCVPMISPSPAPPTPGMSCDICCLANGACPPGADPDGNCCPFGKTCCAFDQSLPDQQGNFGCCDTALGFTCEVTGGVGQCKGGIIPPTPPPTPVPSSTCKPGDTPWEPPQECYSPWVGNCGVGSYCHPSSGPFVNPNADGYCCKVNDAAKCAQQKSCGDCVTSGCEWTESKAFNVVGCSSMCTLDGAECYKGLTPVAAKCPGVVSRQRMLLGSCWRRCTSNYYTGTWHYQQLWAQGLATGYQFTTGYPELGLPATAGTCSCDSQCSTREGQPIGTLDSVTDDCCFDQHFYCPSWLIG